MIEGSKHTKKWKEDAQKRMLGNKYALGHKLSKEHKSKLIKSGNEHWKWKGNNVSYSGLHKWVNHHLGRPMKCENCGSSNVPVGKDEKRWFQWANKSHEYKRDLTDWIRLCTRCHSKYDRSR